MLAKINELITSAKMAAQSGVNFCKVKSPEILAVTGVAAIVTGTVLACKATTKAGSIVEEHRKALADIKEASTNPEYEGEYNAEEDAPRDRFIVYIQTGAKFVKLYAPAVICIGLGIACMLGSNNILKNRWLGAAAAYNMLSDKFDGYRKRVADEVGEEKESDIFHALETKALEVKNKDGMTELKTVKAANTITGSPYAVLFDETAHSWHRDPVINKMFLQGVQNDANRLLKRRGFLYLSEVYDMLGYFCEPANDRYDISPEQAEASRHVGWLLDKNGKPYSGCDGEVKISALDMLNARAYDFQRGFEASVLLDFNVDGDILSRMYKE